MVTPVIHTGYCCKCLHGPSTITDLLGTTLNRPRIEQTKKVGGTTELRLQHSRPQWHCNSVKSSPPPENGNQNSITTQVTQRPPTIKGRNTTIEVPNEMKTGPFRPAQLFSLAVQLITLQT